MGITGCGCLLGTLLKTLAGVKVLTGSQGLPGILEDGLPYEAPDFGGGGVIPWVLLYVGPRTWTRMGPERHLGHKMSLQVM